jgi:cytidine deaminase
VTSVEYNQLLEAARRARQHSYAPYSSFRVGAALLAEGDEVILGCNIENAAFGPTICAERVALFSARARGVVKIKAIAVVGSPGTTCAPCGTCRQVIWELAPAARIVMEGEVQEIIVRTIGELLPMAFGPEILKNPARPL